MRVEREGGVLRVRFDAGVGLNVMTQALLRELGALFAQLPPDVTAILLCAAPGRGFMVGGDLRELESMTADDAEALARFGADVFDAVLTCPRPVVAALGGDALGAGFLLALAADVRVAVPSARLGYPEIRVGLMPGTGGTDLLVRLVGLATARRLCLTGEWVSATRCQDLGLVDEVCEPEELDARALKWATTLQALDATAFAETKAALWAAANAGLQRSREREVLAFRRCFESSGYREQISRFLGRRS
jgi:enoyl-CoA hydratase/carnithine racemase